MLLVSATRMIGMPVVASPGDGRFGKVGRIHVADESKRQIPIAVVTERFVGHHRSKIGPADADVDDVANPLAGVSFPLAAANAITKCGHLVQHGVDFRNDVLTIDHHARVCGRAKGGVQYRAIFGQVNLFSGKHRVDPPAKVPRLCQLNQQRDRFSRDSILRVVQIELRRFDRHRLSATRIIGKQPTQMNVLDRCVVIRESFPLRRRGQCVCHNGFQYSRR